MLCSAAIKFPDGFDYRVIEVNARLSCSSALVSKATRSSLAYTAAKIALGHTLPELLNAVTANFEPSLHYIVTKIPRCGLSKFQNIHRDIRSAMKAIYAASGLAFEESIEKAIRQVDPQYLGIQGAKFDDLEYTPAILPTVVGWPLDRPFSMKIHEISGIDKWFLYKLENIIEMYKKLQAVGSLSD
ncbi:Similar to Carbamoyl-phosphate synthase arginine-specific large chain; acc. no. O94313 [Pyronema omphalodes CBS 100304]|uniref:Ammonium-dependent carbamoyl phosphate synthetase n=1 Tax=Pyronema omphalodes (strain CBS 100304) TaxID=1076935 RepID=U4KU00_PYROM|nr:Similar to Carbamoyl-phosphate synthase arginine-specific large chain; acc. no. O94313 [Pyronema omphalodes CBS 100304]